MNEGVKLSKALSPVHDKQLSVGIPESKKRIHMSNTTEKKNPQQLFTPKGEDELVWKSE